MRIKNTINPVAKALLQSNRNRSTVVPDKKKHNKKKDRQDANQNHTYEKHKDT